MLIVLSEMDTMAVAKGAPYTFTHPTPSQQRKLQTSYGLLHHIPLEQDEVRQEEARGFGVTRSNIHDGKPWKMDCVKPILQVVCTCTYVRHDCTKYF